MRKLVIASIAAAATIFAALPTPALAWHDHGHGHIGVYLGGPMMFGSGYHHGLSPYYWGAPYYAPPVVTVPVPVVPPVYIEQAQPQGAPVAPDRSASSFVPTNPSGYWYYCRRPAGYYPSVRDCSVGWQRVAPLPAQ